MDDNIIRILVSTDNHLGFAERDPLRCNDSLAAFEEVMRTAKRQKVDFILMAGDMFHENKPTRKTLHSCMQIMRKYCFGDDPVHITILNDQKELFKAGGGQVNYEDVHHAISLPIFSIHGNHDDPSREGGNGDSLAALDLLAVNKLINYFGKAERVEDIEITPILIRKGNTNLAIYGLGAIRDERLNRMWHQKLVRFVRLTEEQGRDDFFNIFVLHQNRDYGRGKNNCVHESMIPEWMDLVIWGNEHECQPQLTESLVGTYRLLQPGSSIASSLNATESNLCPKHMASFEIKEKKFRMKALRYHQVRQFVYRDVCLRDYPRLDPNSVKIDEQIRDFLVDIVREMIDEGRAALKDLEDSKSEDIRAEEESSALFTLRDPQKTLVRLRVDHEGFPALNAQRFGAMFVGECANPASALLVAKKRSKDTTYRATEGKLSNRVHSAREDLQKMLVEGGGQEDELGTIRIEDLVNETLTNSHHSLSELTESEMASALDNYIVKKQPNAIIDMVLDGLKRTQKALKDDKTVDDKAAILKAAQKIKEKTEKELQKGTTTTASTSSRKNLPKQDGAKADKEDSANDDDDEDAAEARKNARTLMNSSRNRYAAPTSTAATSTSITRRSDNSRKNDKNDEDGASSINSRDAIMDLEDDDDVPPVTSSNAVTGRQRGGRATSTSTSKANSSRNPPNQPAVARARSSRAAAKKPVNYGAGKSDDDEEEDAEDIDEGGFSSEGQMEESDHEEDQDEEDDEEEASEEEMVPSARGRGASRQGAKAAATAGRKPASTRKAKSSTSTVSAAAAGKKNKNSSGPSSRSKKNVTINLSSDNEGDDNEDIAMIVDGSEDEVEEALDSADENHTRRNSNNRSASSSRGTLVTSSKSAGVSRAAGRGGRSQPKAAFLDEDDGGEAGNGSGSGLNGLEEDGFVMTGASATSAYTNASTAGKPSSSLHLTSSNNHNTSSAASIFSTSTGGGGARGGKKRQLPLSFSQSMTHANSTNRKSQDAAKSKALASGWDD